MLSESGRRMQRCHIAVSPCTVNGFYSLHAWITGSIHSMHGSRGIHSMRRPQVLFTACMDHGWYPLHA
eukprot:358735-Chlamydomonas_euryale.AAC.2